ncbi:helix-turn-helix domain-containing protein [Streptomyces sp. NPDC047097]|uniref:helix-turn-helix domain-containing protein n=1 Tax=Streptomyces sp. NPDC047097 TaxID=3155260 RepID=UPI0034112D46
MIQGELTTLGLGRTEERAYAALLRHRADGAEELARRLGLPRRRLDAALDRLVRHGFASPPDGEGTDGLPRPAQPAAIRSLIHRRQAELHLWSAELERLRLAAERLEPPPDAGTGGEVETVSGRAAVAAWTARLLAGARREVALLDRVPYALRDLPEMGPGVEVRAVLAGPRPAGGSSPDGSGSRPGSGSGAAGVSGGRRPRPDDGRGASFALSGPGVRMAAEVPVRLLIVDRRTALLPPAQPEDPAAGALLVRDGPLRAALLGLFDTAWERAAPPDPAPGDGALTGPERELLALLAAGLKDEAIARRLGVHVHTARRRISRLLEALDARTRFQAGARASVRGWLEA